MTEAKGPYRHLPGGPTLPACWPECPACAYARGVADERERAARVAIRNGTRRIDDPRMPAEVGSDIAEEIRKG